MVLVLATGTRGAATVVAALAWAITGCGGAPVSEVLVSVDNDGRAEAPEYLLFSWLMCRDYIRRDDRVPERGTLDRDANPIATVLIQMDVPQRTKRGVIIQGMVGDRLVSAGSAVIDIQPGTRNTASVRLYGGATPGGEDAARKIDWCGDGGDAGAAADGGPVEAPDAGPPDTSAQADAPDAAGAADALPPPAEAVPAAGLVGWWPLDEITDAVTRDQSGGDNHAVLQMGPSLAPGRVGPRALDLSGPLDLAVIADPANERLDFGTADFTVSLWVKTTQAPRGAPDIAVKWPSTTNPSPMRGGWALTLPLGAALFKAYSGGTAAVEVPGPPINDGAWHHLVGRKTAAELALYLDGRLVATRPHQLRGVSNAAPLQLGGFGNSTTLAFDGQIDEVRIYDRALTPEEITALASVAAGR